MYSRPQWIARKDFEAGYDIVMLARVLVERGQFEEAESLIGDFDLQPHANLDVIARGPIANARAWMRLEQGRFAEALADAEADTALRTAAGALSKLRVAGAWQLPAALALRGLGRDAEAQALMAETVARAASLEDDRVLGICMHVQGLVEEGSRGLELLGLAVERLESGFAKLELARALVSLGAATRLLRSPVGAREPLRRGLDLAVRCGADRLAARADEELRIAGARPRRSALAGADALTHAERRVAVLAAEGLSNPEIARSLYVSRKTVETTLTRAYRKLGVTARSELSAALDTTVESLAAH